MPASNLRTIGQVLTSLKADFPDISISKIRYLESEGLVSPERAPSGYRKYGERDIARLRYILDVQKNHYLPLKVIREHLDMMDRGLAPPKLESTKPTLVGPLTGDGVSGDALAEGAPDPRLTPDPPLHRPAPRTPGAAAPTPSPDPTKPLRLSRAELLEASGLSEPALHELEKNLIVVPRRGTNYYGRDAITIAIAARRLAEYGIDARHLRQVRSVALREYGIIEQALTPFKRRAARSAGQNPEAPRRDPSRDVTSLMIHVHAAMLRIAAEG
ncbi:MerR family transcriptional regulator [Granulicoccus phenolivorans]|uniref:transcriptional regulator FtsR n=1 Tax=Granulicoccus phenolivorans TaxID=266854 RepID=UPI000413CBC7|nr:MerR family transcriptional regulator [Granulicoccus phenolivorans]